MMSDAAEVRALAALVQSAPKGSEWLLVGDEIFHMHAVARCLADALEAAHAEPDDDEREALADLVDSRIDDYKPRYDEAGRCVGSNVADAALAAGFRRSARVPVSRDELAAGTREDIDGPLPLDDITDSLTDRFDIYNKDSA